MRSRSALIFNNRKYILTMYYQSITSNSIKKMKSKTLHGWHNTGLLSPQYVQHNLTSSSKLGFSNDIIIKQRMDVNTDEAG